MNVNRRTFLAGMVGTALMPVRASDIAGTAEGGIFAAFGAQGFDPRAPGSSCFVVTSDVHTNQSIGKGRLNHDRLAAHVAQWNALSPRPAFVAALGDLGNLNEFFGHRPGLGYSEQKAAEDFGTFNRIMNGLDPKIRRVYVVGNHDTYPGDADRALWRRHFPDQPPYGAFDACGLRFLKWDGGDDGIFSSEQEAWIRRECARVPRDAPLVILVHQPAVGLRGRERDIGRLAREALAGRTGPTWLLGGHEHANELSRWTLPGGGSLAVAVHAKDVDGWWAYGVRKGRIVARVFYSEKKGTFEPGPMPAAVENRGEIPVAWAGRDDVVWRAFVGSAEERAARVALNNTGDNIGWLYYVGTGVWRLPKAKTAPRATRFGFLGEFPGRRGSWTPAKCFMSSDGRTWVPVKRLGVKDEVAEYAVPAALADDSDLWVEYDSFGMDGDECIAGLAFLR